MAGCILWVAVPAGVHTYNILYNALFFVYLRLIRYYTSDPIMIVWVIMV